MKKQPLDIHPVDQFMQALDAEIQPVMNEFHWTGMQALLDENFPQDELPAAGAAQSDSKPETGAGKAVKRFKWIFLGGMALIATMAGTQWNAMAIQNSELKQEMNIPEDGKIKEENSPIGMGPEEKNADELKSKSGAGSDANLEIENLSEKKLASDKSDSEMTQANSVQQNVSQNQIVGKDNQRTEGALDSLPSKKNIESESDSVGVKKKFIFW